MHRSGLLDPATADGHDRHVPSGSKDILSVGHEGVYEWAAEHLVQAGGTFLDFGCGTGYGAGRILGAGAAYDGVDSSQTAIEYAHIRFARPDARFYVADLLGDLPAPIVRRSYDVVFSSEVLEHVLDPFAFVAAMADCMRDDGACFIGTPNRLWSKEHMPRGELLAESHVMEFTPPALLALLLTQFGEVTLLFRRLPLGADGFAASPTGRSRLVRAAIAFVHEVAPGASARFRSAIAGRKDERQWSAGDISWLPSDDPQLDMVACVGMVAVCRAPKR